MYRKQNTRFHEGGKQGRGIVTPNNFSSFDSATFVQTLVTQPMLQLRPNCTELRSMDLYNQILCRFQKCKRKVPPPSPLFGRKKKVNFFFQESFFFRHPSKSCSVFTYWKQKKNFGKFRNFFSEFFFESSCTRWRNFSLIFLEST